MRELTAFCALQDCSGSIFCDAGLRGYALGRAPTARTTGATYTGKPSSEASAAPSCPLGDAALQRLPDFLGGAGSTPAADYTAVRTASYEA